jgi:hypothetical protein
MYESQNTKDLRVKLESEVHATEESLIKATAVRHTVINLGQNWPEIMHLTQLAESDEMYDGVIDEYKSWLKDAKKEVKMVVKAKLPLTLANTELAFSRKGPFEGVKR